MNRELFVAGAEIVLTLGLLFFAAMQWYVTWRTDKREQRIQERKEANERAARAAERHRAYQVVWAEHFRLFSLATYWVEADLVDIALGGGLRPEYVEIRNGERMLEALTLLSAEAGYLGAAALTLSHEAAREIQEFNSVIEGWRGEFHQRQHGYIQQTSLTKQNIGRSLEKHEQVIRKRVLEVASLLLDALKQSGEADQPRRLEFSADIQSEFANRAIAALEQAGKSSGP